MRTGSLLIALMVLGCRPKEEEVEPAPGDLVDLTAPIGIDVQSAIGMAPSGALARAVNEIGVAVASPAKRVSVGGVEVDVVFDGTGYGEVPLAEAGSAEIVGGEHPASVHAVSVDWPGVGLLPAGHAMTDVEHAVAATRGFLLASLTDVWWTAPGQVPHRVLEFTDGTLIRGIRTGHVDQDGVLDAIVWGGNSVVLLKGRAAGGMTNGAVIRADGYIAGGADAADATGDGVPDVSIAWISQNTDHHLQVLIGDGLWAFDNQPAKPLTRSPAGLAVGDNTGEGVPQITVISEDGNYQRFKWAEDGFVETGPQLTAGFPIASSQESGWDLNGDGGDELLFFGPLNPGQNREVIVYDLLGSLVTYLRLNPPEAHVAVADANQDGLGDILMLYADLEVVQLTHRNDDYTQGRVGAFNDHGPIAATDLDGDRAPEVVVAGFDYWSVFPGGLEVQEDGDQFWQTSDPAWIGLDLDMAGPVVAADIDGNPDTLEFVSFLTGSTYSRLVGWRITPGEVGATASQVMSVDLSTSGSAGVDLAICDGVAWALTETDLHRVVLSTQSRTGTRATTATRVDCGQGPGGATGALLVGDDVELLDNALGILATEGHSGAGDIAIVTLADGDVVSHCSGTCTAVRWAYADDGSHALAWADNSGVHVKLADGTTHDLGPGAEVSTSDVDGDGHDDLIAVEELNGSVVSVWRSTGQGWGPAEVWHTGQELTAKAFAGDATGDGWPDLWSRGPDGRLYHTLAP